MRHGVGERGPRSRVTGEPVAGEPVAGPETLSEEELAWVRTDFGASVAEHALEGEFHHCRSDHWHKTAVPLLTAAGWGDQGPHSRGNLEGFSRAAPTDKRLEAHGHECWTHFRTGARAAGHWGWCDGLDAAAGARDRDQRTGGGAAARREGSGRREPAGPWPRAGLVRPVGGNGAGDRPWIRAAVRVRAGRHHRAGLTRGAHPALGRAG